MTERNRLPSDRYWVTLDPVDLGPAVAHRFKLYQDELEARGKMGVHRLARRRYYGGDHAGQSNSTSVGHGGEQGESSELTINHYGSIITSVHSMVTQNRPAFSASARDDSAKSLASVQLADEILEYELQRGAEAELIDAVRRFLIFQEVGLGVFWHAESGEVVRQTPVLDEMGQPVDVQEERSGELRTECFSPWDVARDLSARSYSDLTWIIVRRKANKWDLAALYPEHEDEILGQPTADRVDLTRAISIETSRSMGSASDTVYVLELYQLRTPACREGRYARVCGETTLEAGDLQYKRLPVGLHAPERTVDEASGSSRTVDLLGPQEAYDAVMSNLMSNNDAFGRNNILVADGQEVDVDDLSGLQLLTYNMVEGAPPPGPMEVPRLSDSDMRFAEMLQEDMQSLKAISGVVRGDPEESLKSGAALALVAAQAAQHNSGDQRASSEMIRDWGNRVIETYRTFASTKQVIEVTGSDEIRTAKEFTGAELEEVLSVHVEIGNPYLRTIPGKKELADFYADPARFPADPPLTRDQHMAFQATGRIQPFFRPSRGQAIGIREENEALMRGEPHEGLRTDHHENHIREHKAMLDGRRRTELSPEVIAELDNAIRWHEAQWVRMTIEEPYTLAATGQRPAPLPMQAQPPPGPDGQPEAGGGPQPPNGNGGPPGPPEQPPNALGAPPKQPSMPINPQTGERAPAAGGMPQ
jgi:hypothetical protein